MTGDPEDLEPDGYWGVAVPCNLELLYLLKRQRYVGVTLPPADTLRAWKRAYLSVWDGSIDGLEPTPEHRAARRAVLVTTFDRLIDLSADDGGAGPAPGTR
jgi:hypothetical protein